MNGYTFLQRFIKNLLAALLLLMAMNAFGGGYYGMDGAKDVPLEWLEGSPFKSYFVPSLLLFTVVGGSCFVAAVLVFLMHPKAQRFSILAALILLGWIGVQVAYIGFASWLQPTVAIAAAVMLLLSFLLPKNEAAS